jgi:hypothetical protein
LKQNESNICIRGVTRVFWVSRIMVYLQLEDCLKMGQLCVYFNMLTKSPLFVKFMVQINERTKIDISLNTFKTMEHKMLAGNAKSSAPTSSFKTQESAKQSSKGKREDNEAQLEILRNVKIFLTDKVKKSEEIIKTLQNDVEGLKNYLRVEKQV